MGFNNGSIGAMVPFWHHYSLTILLKNRRSAYSPEGEFLLNLTEADQSDSSANGTVHIFVRQNHELHLRTLS